MEIIIQRQKTRTERMADLTEYILKYENEFLDGTLELIFHNGQVVKILSHNGINYGTTSNEWYNH